MSNALSLPSVQSLYIEMFFHEQKLSGATGFVVESQGKAFLVTNRHNLSGLSSETGKTISKTGGIPNAVRIHHRVASSVILGSVIKIEALCNEDGSARWLEHPRLRGRADLAVLPLTSIEGIALFPYPIDTPDDIFVGPADIVSVVGYPFEMRSGGPLAALAVWATGFVATEPNIDHDGLPIFLVDCRSRRGQSGSAVIFHRNGGAIQMTDGSSVFFNGPVTRLLGIYSGRINEQSDLGIVWKLSALREILTPNWSVTFDTFSNPAALAALDTVSPVIGSEAGKL